MNAYPLRSARMHELSGPASVSAALQIAAQIQGDVIWTKEDWLPEQLCPVGFGSADPARFICVQTKNQKDTLAVTEEALRDGAAPLVVAQITAPIDLTAGRRLQLAAKTGRATGLCLIPEGMGSNAAQTRWHVSSVFDADDSTLQKWELIKNKSGTIGAWHVRWHAKTRRIAVVSPARQRPGSQGATG